jgi:hypothetical protein
VKGTCTSGIVSTRNQQVNAVPLSVNGSSSRAYQTHARMVQVVKPGRGIDRDRAKLGSVAAANKVARKVSDVSSTARGVSRWHARLAWSVQHLECPQNLWVGLWITSGEALAMPAKLGLLGIVRFFASQSSMTVGRRCGP